MLPLGPALLDAAADTDAASIDAGSEAALGGALGQGFAARVSGGAGLAPAIAREPRQRSSRPKAPRLSVD